MPGGPDAGPALQLLRTSRGQDRLTRASALPVVPDARQVKWQQTLPGSLSTKSGANSGFQLEILRGSLSPMNWGAGLSVALGDADPKHSSGPQNNDDVFHCM